MIRDTAGGRVHTQRPDRNGRRNCRAKPIPAVLSEVHVPRKGKRDRKIEEVKEMKRIQSACLNQTIHFQMKEEMEHELAVSEVRAEYEQYRKTLDKKRVKYQIVEELPQPDGSLVIRIKKQYNNYDVGNYLN